MRNLLSIGVRLSRDRRAVTALEYGMMVALIAAVIVAAVTQLGTKALSMWTTAASIKL